MNIPKEPEPTQAPPIKKTVNFHPVYSIKVRQQNTRGSANYMRIENIVKALN